MTHEYCADIVHEYLVHRCCAEHHVHHHVRGDVRDRDHVHGLSLPCEYELDQCQYQFHDCDGVHGHDDDGHPGDPVRQN